MSMRRLGWTLGLLLIAGCGGNDDDEGGEEAPPPSAPSVTVGAPVTVAVAAVTGGNAETGAVSLDFNVATPGSYVCNAHGAQGTEVRDAQLAIHQGATELARDDDSGEGFDARITRQLAPGGYTLRVWEWQGRDAQITVTCTPAPAAPANPSVLALGTPATVRVVAGEGPGSRAVLNLTVAAAGNYRCDASSSGLDAQMAILQNGNQLAQDSDSGDGFNARITRDLAPGVYQVQVWEWQHREAAIQVSCAAGGPPATPIANGGVLTLGTPGLATIPAGEGPAGQVHLNLVVTQAGPYTCDAVDSSHDAQLAIVQAGNVLAEDSDSGEGTNARLTHTLQPGAYQVRLWEWRHQATQITVTCRAGS